MWKFTAFSVDLYIPFLEDACAFVLPLGVVKYSQHHTPYKNSPVISWIIAVLIKVFFENELNRVNRVRLLGLKILVLFWFHVLNGI